MSRDVLPRPKALFAKKLREVLDYHNKMAAENDDESGEDTRRYKSIISILDKIDCNR